MVRSVGRGNGLGKVLCGRRQGGTRTQEEVRVSGGGVGACKGGRG